MEFLAIVALLAGAGVAMVLLAMHPDSPASIIAFFQNAAQTLLGAVIALAYAAQRSGKQTATTTTTTTDNTDPGK